MAHIKVGSSPQGNEIKQVVKSLRALRATADTIDMMLDSFTSPEQAETLAELLGMEKQADGSYNIPEMIDLKTMIGNLQIALNTEDMLEIQWRIL